MRRKDPPPSIRANEMLFHVEHPQLASPCFPGGIPGLMVECFT